MRIRARLARLERTAGVSGCPACGDRRGRVVLHCGREQRDGSVRFERPGPMPCPRCGEVPEEVVEVVEVVIETREDLARWAAQTDAADTSAGGTGR